MHVPICNVCVYVYVSMPRRITVVQPCRLCTVTVPKFARGLRTTENPSSSATLCFAFEIVAGHSTELRKSLRFDFRASGFHHFRLRKTEKSIKCGMAKLLRYSLVF